MKELYIGLQEHFLEISPEDSEEIKAFCKDIKGFMKFNMPVMDIKGVKVRNKSKMSKLDLFRKYQEPILCRSKNTTTWWNAVSVDTGRKAVQYLCKDTNVVFQEIA